MFMKRGVLLFLGAWFLWLCPASAQSIQAQLERAVAAQKSGDPETAIRIYREVLRQRPELGEIHSNIGAALVEEGHFPEAIQEYKLALQAKPGNPAIIGNLALAHYKSGEYPEVVALLSPIQPQFPDNLQLALLLSACLMQQNQSARVVEILTPFEKRADRGVAFLLGTALLNEGQTARAQVILDRILRDGESAETQLLLGAMKLRAREFNSAIDYFRRAVELNPSLPEVHSYYGRALRASGDTPAATAEFRAELAHYPNDFVSNLELSVLLKQEGNLAEARQHLATALHVRPDDPGALYQLASIDILEGKNQQALAELERLVKQNPAFTEAQVSLATVYYRLNRREDGDRVRAVVRKLQQEQQARDQGQPADKPPDKPSDKTSDRK
jgi:Tfp pilus assembly protein PilF